MTFEEDRRIAKRDQHNITRVDSKHRGVEDALGCGYIIHPHCTGMIPGVHRIA